MYKVHCEISLQTIKKAYNILESCELCPKACRINRLNNEKGFCGVGTKAVVSSVTPHFGEESVLVGKGGLGWKQYSSLAVISAVFFAKITT